MFRDRGTDISLHYQFKKEIYDPETIKGKFRMKRFVRILPNISAVTGAGRHLISAVPWAYRPLHWSNSILSP